jgi:hypothetical protein
MPRSLFLNKQHSRHPKVACASKDELPEVPDRALKAFKTFKMLASGENTEDFGR